MSEVSKDKSQNEGSNTSVSDANQSIVHKDMAGEASAGNRVLTKSKHSVNSDEDRTSVMSKEANDLQKAVLNKSNLLLPASRNIWLDVQKKPVKDTENTISGSKVTMEDKADKGNWDLRLQSQCLN